MAASLEAADREAAAGGFEVWPVNMPIVEAFCAVATQWRTTTLLDGRVVWQGLDYSSVIGWLDKLKIALSPAQWRGLSIMESAAAGALNGQA